VLLLLTIGLVLVGAVSLVIGFVSQNTLPIYISIACSVAAGLVLLVFSRMNRRQAVVPVGATGDDTGGPATTEFVLQEARAAARPAASAAAADDGFPIEDYDQLLVSEIVPLLPELDLEELDAVRAREEDGKARASILRRIDALAEELDGTAAPADVDIDDDIDEEDDEVEVEVEIDDDDEFFPIADYEDLRVNQILPLLPELDDDELAIVAERERSGADRYSILVRIDELLGVTVAKKAPAKKAPAKKSPAKRRAGDAQTTQKAAAKKAPAKKTAAKKAPAKKAAAKKATPAKKAAKKR
jgi:hypothetical protein